MTGISASPTDVEGLWVIERAPIEDARGSFCRVFEPSVFEEWGWDGPVRQVNHSCTAQRGAVRGMHFQLPPHDETKLVTCLAGEVYDVAVDLRRGSPTFLSSFGTHLSADNRKSLLIPRGFAHGFQALTDNVELLYLHDRDYAPTHEGGLLPTDPRLGIDWPIPISQMSERDLTHKPIEDDFEGID